MLLSPRPLLRHLLLAAGLASLAGCTQDLIAPGGGEQITISGTLINKTNQPLPRREQSRKPATASLSALMDRLRRGR
jgi:hypothetical protein